MLSSWTTLALAALAVTVVKAADVVKCGPGQKCPESMPCCSQYNQCGIGAYCLGGCNPMFSNQIESCVPAPVCKSQDFQLTSLAGVEPNTRYLGDSTKANWVSSGEPAVFENEVLLTMPEDSVGTLLASTTYLWYGKVSATLKTSRGQGVVTAFILMSDVRDEIDFEFIGSDLSTAQSNYYFQGITNYQNGGNISLSDTFSNDHTYTIDWTPEQITWSIDGQVGRTKKRSETYNDTTKRYEYPQTPSRVQLSLWPGGLPSNGEGTIEWAGGLVDWNSEDMQNNQYYYARVKDVSIECYDPPSDVRRTGSKAYIYTADAGTQETLEITDKPMVLKSLLGTGTNMSADYPSARPRSSSSTSASSTGSQTSSSSAAATSTEVATVPGLTGAGPGTNGQRGAADAQQSDTTSDTTSDTNSGSDSNSNSNSGSGSGSGSGGSGSGSSSSSSAAPSASGFSQGSSSTGNTPTQQGNGASGPGERVLGGSIFAGLVAVAGMLLL